MSAAPQKLLAPLRDCRFITNGCCNGHVSRRSEGHHICCTHASKETYNRREPHRTPDCSLPSLFLGFCHSRGHSHAFPAARALASRLAPARRPPPTSAPAAPSAPAGSHHVHVRCRAAGPPEASAQTDPAGQSGGCARSRLTSVRPRSGGRAVPHAGGGLAPEPPSRFCSSRLRHSAAGR